MNKEKLTWGLILLFVGLVLLLSNLDVINFYWQSVFRFWPVFLVVIGVNLLVPRQGIGNAISIAVTILALAFLGWQGTKAPEHSWWDFQLGNRFNIKKWTSDKKLSGAGVNYSYPYDANIKKAHLSIKEGVIDYHIEGGTEQLYNADFNSSYGGHSFEVKTKDSLTELKFSMTDGKKKNWRMSLDSNKVLIKLNERPVWDVDVEMGAGSADFDLSTLKVERFKIEGGVLAFKTRFGMPLKETSIRVELGAASATLEIPKEAACRINVDSGLSSKNFKGFVQQDDDTYETEGFANADHKFLINLEGGLSSFQVERY